MAEARQLKAGKWRVYNGPELTILRDPATGSIVTFDSLMAARRWWWGLHPDDPPLQEAAKCARCGGYFGLTTPSMLYAGRYYHSSHTPQVVGAEHRR